MFVAISGVIATFRPFMRRYTISPTAHAFSSIQFSEAYGLRGVVVIDVYNKLTIRSLSSPVRSILPHSRTKTRIVFGVEVVVDLHSIGAGKDSKTFRNRVAIDDGGVFSPAIPGSAHQSQFRSKRVAVGTKNMYDVIAKRWRD